jgi:putative transcriptional regulator
MKRPKRESTRGQIPAVADRIINGLGELKEVLERKVPLPKRFTVRTVELNLEPGDYPGQAIQSLRQQLRVSQPVFAKLLGVSVHTVRAWEQGKQEPPPIARRLMDEIQESPDRWMEKLSQASIVTTGSR